MPDCEHDLKYVKELDTVICIKCLRVWGKAVVETQLIPYAPYPDPWRTVPWPYPWYPTYTITCTNTAGGNTGPCTPT